MAWDILPASAHLLLVEEEEDQGEAQLVHLEISVTNVTALVTLLVTAQRLKITATDVMVLVILPAIAPLLLVIEICRLLEMLQEAIL